MADVTNDGELPVQQSNNRQRRNRRRGNGNRNQEPQPTHQQSAQQRLQVAGQNRRFGGQLTRPNELHPEAPAFVSASIAPTSTQSVKPTQKSSSDTRSISSLTNKPRNLTRRFSRSTAPDLATRIIEDIAHNLYECAICSSEISRKSRVWSCHICWTVFHIGCIKKWSKNEGSAVQRPTQEEENDEIRKWRCPGCNLPQDTLPQSYSCWCEKELDPKPIAGLPPHSCGQTCGRDRKFPKACPHPCDQLCHAGPCPPCASMGPLQSCYCGKQTSRRKCLETEYEAGWSCKQVCGDVMPCGDHTCQRPCHEGLCGACPAPVTVKCYCGKTVKDVPCSEKGEEKESYAWLGTFKCDQICERNMDCGNHKCQKQCHPQEESVPSCPRSPNNISHCPCGKTAVSELLTASRSSCTDPIPTCQQICTKTLLCGHKCAQKCHSGECSPCMESIPINCRCGRNTFHATCYGQTHEPPWCLRTCRVTLNCGRHECGERCCPGERLANERLATKRKQKSLALLHGPIPRNDIEAEHICTRVCGRLLKCGNHNCTELCHKGPCQSCKEAIFDDLSCNCGRTTLIAPLPCGTRPPPCNYPCRRPKVCGHPQVAHNCHGDDEECPKCPFLTEKRCLCSKKMLKNQPCWRADVLCGNVCGKLLKCGSHHCRKTCHRPGECEDAQTHCQQACGKAKKTCSHPCEQQCHAPSSCKEDKPCPFKVIITCDCQRKKEEVKCNVKAGIPDPPGRQNSLKCDDECARLERNRRLATALNIPDGHVDDHIPYSANTLSIYAEDIPWAHQQEEILRLFAADEKEKRYRFKPMKSRQRAFIHSLAEDFGFDGESLDPEPHRHVHLFKTPKFVAAPMKTLAQAARIRRAQMNVTVPVESAQPLSKSVIDPTQSEYNGLIIRNPRFALTEDELRLILKQVASTTDFDIVFFSKSDAVALLPQDDTRSTSQLSVLLQTLQPTIFAALTKEELAASVSLCKYDLNGTGDEPILLYEAGAVGPTRSSGWSKVAAKRAIPMAVPSTQPVGQRSTFTVLNSKVAEAKRKKKEDEEMEKKRRELQEAPVVDDWSAELEEENAVDG